MSGMVRACTGADLPHLKALFKEAYAFNPRLQEDPYLDWQFRHSPWHPEGEEYTLLVLEAADEIQGFIGYVPLEFWMEGTLLKGCWTMTWHAFRKDGRGLQLLSQVLSRFDNRFHIGLAEASLPIMEAYQVPCLRRLRRWCGVLSAQGVASLIEGGDRLLAAFQESARRLQACRAGTAVQPCSSFDPLWEGFPPWPGLVGHVRRTGRYLNWRYFQIPGHAYRALAGPSGQFAVYRIEGILGRPEQVLRIVEWCFTEPWADQAMAAILETALREGVILMDFHCTAPAAADSLQALGFFEDADLAPAMPDQFRPLRSSGGIRLAIDLPPHRTARELDFSRWYIPKGDSDLDRFKV